MAGFLVWQIVATARAQQQLDHSDQVTSQVEKLQSLFIDQETGLRGFQLTGDQVMLAPWEAAAGPIQVQFATLQGLLAADPQQSATLRDLEDRYNRWLQFARGVLAKDPKLIADPHVNQRGKQMMDGIRATAGLLQAREANMRQAQYRRAQALQGRELVSLLLSALLVGVVLALFTRHHVKTISVS